MITLPVLESGVMCPDAMVEVFLMSPLESLKQFRFVCKNWGNFLSNPTFNQLHFKRNPRKKVLAFPTKNKQLGFLKQTKPPIPDVCFSLQMLPSECHNMLLVGSCEGVLAFSFLPMKPWKNLLDAFVWNPTTKVGKVFRLPPPSQSQFEVDTISTGLGFDTDKDDFKFIRLVNFSGKKGTVVQVFSFLQNSWKELSYVPFSPKTPNCGFVIKGVPHWVGKDDAGIPVVFSFDPTTEFHRLFPYPVADKSRVVYIVGVRDVVGALVFSGSDFTLGFYSFESESEAWVKKITIGPLQTFFDIRDIRTMQYFRGTIITWGLPWDTYFHDVAENQSLPVADLVNHLLPKLNEAYYHRETLVGVPGGQHYYPRSVGEVFRDFKGRRASLVRALTTDVEEFYTRCDSEVEHCYVLHGLPHDEWQVTRRDIHDQMELPMPARIKFARNAMEKNDWLSFVALRSDDWLLSVAFYFASRFGFNQADRQRLFTLMNDLPTVFEVVTRDIKKQSEAATVHFNE